MDKKAVGKAENRKIHSFISMAQQLVMLGMVVSDF